MSENFCHFLASLAEKKIALAQEQGYFDNLPGKGKPLPEEDFEFVSAELKTAYKILKNAGYLPPELAERKQINNVLELLEHCTDEQEKIRQMKKLEFLILKINTLYPHSLRITENDPYYNNLLKRITIIKH